MPPDMSPEEAAITKEEMEKALRVVFKVMTRYGDNWLKGHLFADGRFFSVEIKIEEILDEVSPSQRSEP